MFLIVTSPNYFK